MHTTDPQVQNALQIDLCYKIVDITAVVLYIVVGGGWIDGAAE